MNEPILACDVKPSRSTLPRKRAQRQAAIGRLDDLDVKLAALDPLSRAVWRKFCEYAPDEAETFVSQKRIAKDLGVWRETVTRKVEVLIAAGHIRIKDQTPAWSGWLKNHTEILDFIPVSHLAMRRITRLAHARRAGQCPTSRHSVIGGLEDDVSRLSGCDCWACRGTPPHRLRPRPPDLPVAEMVRVAEKNEMWFSLSPEAALTMGRPIPGGLR